MRISKTQFNVYKRGFTLLEILLVVVSIGILSAIIILAVRPRRQISLFRERAATENLISIQKAIEQYVIDNLGRYPTTITDTPTEICNTGSESVGGATSCVGYIDLRVLVPTYISAIPKNPVLESEQTGYEISLADNSDGTNSLQLAVASSPSIGLNCPSGYVKVAGDSTYGTNDFCVMKYEAKCASITAPTVGLTTPTQYGAYDNNASACSTSNDKQVASLATGYPIANVSQVEARGYCHALGAGYGLMNNDEWMTMARNIDQQASNWTGGSVGNGRIWAGHSDQSPYAAIEASTDDNNGYFNTGNTAPNNQKRTLVLSNGEVIWDIMGNQYEVLDNALNQSQFPSPKDNWSELTSITNYGGLSYNLMRPVNPSWDSTQGMGRIYSASSAPIGIFLRSGDWWESPSSTGLYSIVMNRPQTNKYLGSTGGFGFRCTYRQTPNPLILADSVTVPSSFNAGLYPPIAMINTSGLSTFSSLSSHSLATTSEVHWANNGGSSGTVTFGFNSAKTLSKVHLWQASGTVQAAIDQDVRTFYLVLKNVSGGVIFTTPTYTATQASLNIPPTAQTFTFTSTSNVRSVDFVFTNNYGNTYTSISEVLFE